jgi:hypothetical protein
MITMTQQPPQKPYEEVLVPVRVYRSDALHTYQDLVARFGWHYSTILRKFKKYKKLKWGGTVRVPESSVQQALADHTANEKATKRR